MRDDIRVSLIMTGVFLLVVAVLGLTLGDADLDGIVSFWFYILLLYLPVLIIVVGLAFMIGQSEKYRKIYFFWPYYFIIFLLPVLGTIDGVSLGGIMLRVLLEGLISSFIAAYLTRYYLVKNY